MLEGGLDWKAMSLTPKDMDFMEAKHAAAQGFFLYGIEPGGNRVEVTTGGYFVYDPEFVPVVRPEAELLTGMAWGVQLPESFRSYGTPIAEPV